jgi:low affinity Fe/Cu permease
MPFLMVFLIQHTRKIDSQAVQIKLDKLIRATNGARNTPRDLEEMSEKQLDEIRIEYEFHTKAATRKLRTGEDDIGSLDMGFQDNGVTL